MAGPSVGHIEVTVDANTGKMQAKIVKEAKAAGKAGGEALEEGLSDIEGTELIAKLRAIRVKAETAMAGMSADFDVTAEGVQAELRRLQAQLRAAELVVSMRPEVDDADMRTVFQQLRRDVEHGLKEIAGDEELGVEPKSKLTVPEMVALGQEITNTIRGALTDVELAAIVEMDKDSVAATNRELDAAIHDLQLEIDRDHLAREATLARLEIESALQGIDADVETVADVRRARLTLEAFANRAEARKILLDVGLDLSDAEIEEVLADFEGRKARLEAEKVRIELEADTRAFTEEIFGVKELTERQKLKMVVELTADETVERLKLQRLMASLEAVAGELGIDTKLLGAAEIEFELDALRQRQEADKINLQAEIDRDLTDKLHAEMAKAGEDSGGAFLDSMSTRIKLIAAAIIGLAEPAGVALQGVLAAATSVVSSAFTGLAGGIGAATPLLAGMVPVIASGVVGMQGLGEATSAISEEFARATKEGTKFSAASSEIQEAMAGLGPAASQVALAFAEIFPALQDFQTIISDRLLGGIAGEMLGLADTVLPDLRASLGLAADSLNDFFGGLADVAIGIDFTTLFAGIQPAMDDLGRALLEVLAAFAPFIHAATPAALQLAENLAQAATALGDMITAGDKSGALAKFFLDGVNSLEIWWDLVRNIGDALFTLFQAGTASGDNMVRTLADIVERFDTWMESTEGQAALLDFFATGQQLASALVPVLKGLQGFFENLVTPEAVDRFEALAVSVGGILPVIGSLFELVGESEVLNTMAGFLDAIGASLTEIMPDLNEMAAAIGVALTEALVASVPLLEFMSQTVVLLAQGVTILAQGFNALPGPLQETVVALGAFMLLTGPMTKFFAAMGTNFGKFITQIGNMRTAIADIGPSLSAAFAGLRGAGTLGEVGKQLGNAAKGVGAAAGASMAGALGVAFGAQMALESDSMVGQVTGISTVIASAMAGFAIHPAVGITTLALGALVTVLQRNEKASRDAAAAANEYADALEAMADGAGSVVVVREVLENLREEEEAVRDVMNEVFTASASSVGAWARGIIEGTTSVQDAVANFVSGLGPAADQLEADLRSGKTTLKDLVDEFENAGTVNALPKSLQAVGAAFEDMGLDMDQISNMFKFMLDETKAYSAGQEELTRRTAEAGVALTEENLLLQAQMDAIPGVIASTAAMAEAKIIAADAAAAYRAKVGILIDALLLYRESTEEAAEATKAKMTKALKESTDAMAKWATATLKANAALHKLATGFDQMAIRGEAMSAMFDLKSAPLEIASQMRNIEVSISELSEEAEKVKVGDILANNIEADKVLDAIDELRPDIQEQVTNTFSVGGAEAATKLANDYVSKVAKELGVSDVEAAKLLGLDDLKATIAVAFELSQEEQARRQLEVLVDLTEETPLTASLALALDTGALSPDQVFSIVQPLLVAAGVFIPPEIRFPPNKEVEDAARAQLSGATAEMDMTLVPPTGQDLLNLVNAGLAELNIDPISLEAVPPTALETKPLIDAELAKIELNPITANVDAPLPSDLKAAIDEVMVGVVPASIKFPSFTDPAQLEGFAAQFAPVIPDVEIGVTVDPTAIESVNTLIGNVQGSLDDLDGKQIETGITLNDQASTQIDTISTGLGEINETVADPDVTANTGVAMVELFGVAIALGEIDSTVSKPEVDAQTAVAMTKIAQLQTALNNIRNKTVTVTVNTVTSGLRPAIGESMAGSIVNGPGLMRVGERGYREAIIPLQLPLNRIDPSVRMMAAMLRGDGQVPVAAAPMGPRNIINQTFELRNADPGAVASQVLNRAAAAANR